MFSVFSNRSLNHRLNAHRLAKRRGNREQVAVEVENGGSVTYYHNDNEAVPRTQI